MSIVCPGCGDQNRETARFCDNCGMNLIEALKSPKICPKCRNENGDTAIFCDACGARLDEARQTAAPSKPTESAAQPKPNILPEQKRSEDIGSPAVSPGNDGFRHEPVATPQPGMAAREDSSERPTPEILEKKSSSPSARPVSLPEEGQISGSSNQPKEHSQIFSPSGVGWGGNSRNPPKAPPPLAEVPSKSRRAKKKKKIEIPEITLQGEVCGVKWTNAVSTATSSGSSYSSTSVTQYYEVCNFYVQTHDEIGNIQHRIPLEFTGRLVIRDGHQVQPKGNWQGTVFCATEIYNITTQTLIPLSPIPVKRKIKAGCITAIVLIILLMSSL